MQHGASDVIVPVGTGQVFTPEWLADAMAKAALQSLPKRTTLRVCEPAAGTGALLQAVLRAAEPSGCRIDAEAWETDPVLVAELQRKFGAAVHLHHADTLRALVEEPSPVPFDVVIANPPWLRESGNSDVFRAVRKHHPDLRSLYAKDADLHHFFWLSALRWLRPGGVAVMLTPAYVLSTRSATALRAQLLAQGTVLGIWRSGSLRVFPDASVECAVTVWRKHDTGHSTAHEVCTAPMLDSALQAIGPHWRLPRDGSAWRIGDEAEVAGPTLADWFHVVEGVSTGANAVRAEHVPTLQRWWEDKEANPTARIGRPPVPGDGIFVLRRPDLEVAGIDLHDTRLFARWLHDEQLVLMLRDGDLPRIDVGLPPETAIERHVWRFRPVLQARAEIQRNSRRSWYALTWPRSEAWSQGTIVTPKWSRNPAFRAMTTAGIPMTDCRILVPRTEAARLASDALLAHWNDMSLTELSRYLSRKGAMLEFYGDGLARLPIPDQLRDPKSNKS
jgi:hypothetical protein